MVKTLHLLGGTLMLGSVAFYCMQVLLKTKPQVLAAATPSTAALLRSTLLSSLLFDGIIAMLFPLQFWSGTKLTLIHHYAFSTHWILVAYVALGLCTAIWGALVAIKLRYLRELSKNPSAPFKSRRWFKYGSLVLIVLLIVIIHDAIVKHSFI